MRLTATHKKPLKGLRVDYVNTGQPPIDLAEAKAWGRIGSDEEDVTLGYLIDEVIDEVENKYNFTIVDKTVTLVAQSYPVEIRLPFGPVKEIVSAMSGDDDVSCTKVGDVIVFDTAGNNIEIVYETGWASLPVGIKGGLKKAMLSGFSDREDVAAMNVQKMVNASSRIFKAYQNY